MWRNPKQFSRLHLAEQWKRLTVPLSGGFNCKAVESQGWKVLSPISSPLVPLLARAMRANAARSCLCEVDIYSFFFLQINLGPCLKNRINAEHRCVEDPALRLGVPEGVCDETARPLYKLLLSQLYDLTQGPDIPDAIKSPAHATVSQFSISELQVNEMFGYWESLGNPREAICQFVVDNLDELAQYIPRTYPRTIVDS